MEEISDAGSIPASSINKNRVQVALCFCLNRSTFPCSFFASIVVEYAKINDGNNIFMRRRQRRRTIPIKPTIIVFAVVVLLGLIFLISSGGKIYKSSKKNSDEISQNTAVLKELSAKVPENDEEYKPPAEINLSEEEKKIIETPSDSFNDDEIRSWFQGSVVLGDSITSAAQEFGFLDTDVIIARIGTSLTGSDDLLEDGISRNPKLIVLFFGANDIDNYGGDPNAFVSAYNDAVSKIRASLPDVPIYLHAILPVQEGVYAGDEFAPRVAFNEALKAYCEKTDNVYYINADFILEQMPELFEPDGMHPVASFYPRWLTYIADVTGLSGSN